jgi:hypothetical protein
MRRERELVRCRSRNREGARCERGMQSPEEWINVRNGSIRKTTHSTERIGESVCRICFAELRSGCIGS